MAAEKNSVTLFKAWQLVLTETALLIIQEDLTNIQVNCSIWDVTIIIAFLTILPAATLLHTLDLDAIFTNKISSKIHVVI